MKLSDISTTELLRILQATERTVGPNAVEVAILRRELVRRSQPTRACLNITPEQHLAAIHEAAGPQAIQKLSQDIAAALAAAELINSGFEVGEITRHSESEVSCKLVLTGQCPGGNSCSCCRPGCDCGCRDDCIVWQRWKRVAGRVRAELLLTSPTDLVS